MKSKKGFTLVLSVITALIIFILVGSLFASLVTHMNLIARQSDNIRAYEIAEAGLARGIIQLRSATPPAWPAAPAGILATPLGNGTYAVAFTALPIPLGGLPSFIITSIGTSGNVQRTLSLEVFQRSFAQYVFFTNHENGVFFDNHDIFDGPVHTNDHLNIAGQPTFWGAVTAHDPNTVGINNPNPHFNGGITLGVNVIQIPAANQVLAPVRGAAALPGGLLLNGDTTIAFLGVGGGMSVTNAGVTVVNPLPANGAIYVDGGNLTISGTLDGRATIGVSDVNAAGNVVPGKGNITIADDLTYAGGRDVNGLPTNPNNMLGLSAAHGVNIGPTLHNNLEIDASIMAVGVGESFTFPQFQGGQKGFLTVYGGIMQDTRGAVGMVGGAHGYQRNYRFDQRMRFGSPLWAFPLSEVDAAGNVRIMYSKRFWQGK